MTDITWPETLAPYAATFYLQHNTIVHESAFTRQRQVLGRSAPRWICRLSLRGMESSGRAAELDALLARLRGPQNRALLYDFRRPTSRGTVISHDTYAAGLPVRYFTGNYTFTGGYGFIVGGNGTPRNKAATRGATLIPVEGYQPATVPWKAGDYIGFSDNLCYMVVADMTTDEDGEGFVQIEPPLRLDVAAGTMQATQVRARFRLADDNAGNNPTDLNGLSMFELEFIEDAA